MRTAVTKGTLRIPPTYFALAHADAMPDIEWRAFTLVADIADPAVAVPVEQAPPREQSRLSGLDRPPATACTWRENSQPTSAYQVGW